MCVLCCVVWGVMVFVCGLVSDVIWLNGCVIGLLVGRLMGVCVCCVVICVMLKWLLWVWCMSLCLCYWLVN